MEPDQTVFRDLVGASRPDRKVRPEGRLLFVNTAYCDLVGKTKDELAGAVFMPVQASAIRTLLPRT